MQPLPDYPNPTPSIPHPFLPHPHPSLIGKISWWVGWQSDKSQGAVHNIDEQHRVIKKEREGLRVIERDRGIKGKSEGQRANENDGESQ